MPQHVLLADLIDLCLQVGHRLFLGSTTADKVGVMRMVDLELVFLQFDRVSHRESSFMRFRTASISCTISSSDLSLGGSCGLLTRLTDSPYWRRMLLKISALIDLLLQVFDRLTFGLAPAHRTARVLGAVIGIVVNGGPLWAFGRHVHFGADVHNVFSFSFG